jgi:zinc-finger of transposase IS204/IS1001/IS1096/IS1165
VMDNSSATAMLGLEGMAVLAVSERDGEVGYAVETMAATGWCPTCGAQARLHDRRPAWVRDLPAADRPVTLVRVKRIWRCTHVECEKQTWTETHPQIRARTSWTERAREQACRRVGCDGHSVAAVARDFGVGWAAVMAAVIEYGTGLVEHPDRVAAVSAVGVDETAFLRANATRSTVFATGIVDLQRGKLIDIVPGRSRKVLSDWLIQQPHPWTGASKSLRWIRSAATDQPCRAAYRTPYGHWIRSMWYGWGWLPSMTYAAVSSSRPSVIGAAAATRCTAFAASCAEVPSTSPTPRGRGCSPASRPATTAVKSPPGSPPKSCAPSTAAATGPLLASTTGSWRASTPGTTTAGPYHHYLAYRVPGLLQHRPNQQRTHRSGQPVDQENPAGRLRTPKFRQLSATPVAALRNHLATSQSHTTARPLTTLGRVEPLYCL